MSKRKIDEILNDSLPTQSKELYEKKWREFLDFIGDKQKPAYFSRFLKGKYSKGLDNNGTGI